MNKKRDLLLISYVFPPHYGIGGKRWAKYAAELTRQGYKVHVIYSKNPFKKSSLWYDEIKDNPDIILYELPARYPRVLVDFERTFFQKVLYMFWVTALPMLVKGSYLDRSVFWKNVMLNEAGKIIKKHAIKHVICTGAPFDILYFSTLLKRRFKDLFLINDMRDPWTWGSNPVFSSLSEKRMKYEKKKEWLTIERSDLITVPNQEMLSFLHEYYPEYKDKIIELSHFFDIKELSVSPKTKSDKIRLAYYGNIYHDIETQLEQAASFFGRHKDKFTFDIYTDKRMHKAFFKAHHADNVRTFPQEKPTELFKKFSDYDYIFIISPQYNKNSISTKFYEIFYTQTPIIFFSEKGKAGEFIEKNNLGIQIEPGELENKLLLLYRQRDFKFNSGFDISKYEIKNTVAQITTEIENAKFLTPANQKNLLLTFDYELFLGSKSGTAKNCIIEPTNKILLVLTKYGIKKCLFFVDTIYLMRLSSIDADEAAKEDYKLIVDQLIDLLKKGHYIFPHIHPHWLDANYHKFARQWGLRNFDKYRFHKISETERRILFNTSITFIQQIQEKAGVFYDIDGYRAGGWCIQPFSAYKPFFEKYNIKYDFSVLKDFKLLNENFYYDFKNFPKRMIYKFTDRIDMADKNGKFTEFSVSNVNITRLQRLADRLFLKLLFKLRYFNFGDGQSIQKLEEQQIEKAGSNKKEKDIEMMSIELLIITKLQAYKQYSNDNSFVHFVTHPKMISQHNLFCFDRYLKYMTESFEIKTDYKKMN